MASRIKIYSYQQFESLVSTIPIADIDNWNCRYFNCRYHEIVDISHSNYRYQ